MSQRERVVLAMMRGVVSGGRTQTEATRLLNKCVHHVRRTQGTLSADHGHSASLRNRVLQVYRKKYSDFGPTLACEKLDAGGLRTILMGPDKNRTST